MTKVSITAGTKSARSRAEASRCLRNPPGRCWLWSDVAPSAGVIGDGVISFPREEHACHLFFVTSTRGGGRQAEGADRHGL